jgi:hypothetical protein
MANITTKEKSQLLSIFRDALLVIANLIIFIGTYVILFSIWEHAGAMYEIPNWVPLVILIFDIFAVILIKICSLNHRAKKILLSVVLSLSAGALLTIFAIWAIPV